MRVLVKIFLCLLFLAFSLTNYISVDTLHSQSSVSAAPETTLPGIYVSTGAEGYFALPSAKSDNGISSGLYYGKVQAVNHDLSFVYTEHNISNTDIIALLFKTEINANAPPSGVFC